MDNPYLKDNKSYVQKGTVILPFHDLKKRCGVQEICVVSSAFVRKFFYGVCCRVIHVVMDDICI
ncbi:hypothetical protein PU02_0359 [Bartonella ancashensis]|uniref:Uncharacterized protein n=1 Tax=Bartonella ancashensis TaxID=1318743 RepID=A0A0M5KUD1_9HYPH|nr:hypothetical protein PU02_0359 [Bartonella ancashensis]